MARRRTRRPIQTRLPNDVRVDRPCALRDQNQRANRTVGAGQFRDGVGWEEPRIQHSGDRVKESDRPDEGQKRARVPHGDRAIPSKQTPHHGRVGVHVRGRAREGRETPRRSASSRDTVLARKKRTEAAGLTFADGIGTPGGRRRDRNRRRPEAGKERWSGRRRGQRPRALARRPPRALKLRERGCSH